MIKLTRYEISDFIMLIIACTPGSSFLISCILMPYFELYRIGLFNAKCHTDVFQEPFFNLCTSKNQ